MHRPHRLSPTATHPTPSALAGLVVLAALATGCVEDDFDRQAPDTLERDGIEYDRLGPIVEDDVDPLADGAEEPRAAIEPLRLPLDPTVLASLPREELADKLRPVIATGEGGGQIYVASEPAWAAADAVLQSDGSPFAVEPRPPNGRPAVEVAVDEGFRAIFGTDDRHYVSNTGFGPFNAIARLRMYRNGVSEGTCSGVYIGPWTMITAAHCLVYSDTQRADRIIFEPGRAGSSLPYGSHDCRLDDASTGNDYVWSVPSAFYTGQDPNFDYAVIDTYPCHSAPAHMAGYQANAGTGNFLAYGYPGATCPGAPSAGTYMCGMSSGAYPNGVWMESETIDTTDGQSGGPWFRYYSGSPSGYKPVGTLTGYIEYFDFLRCGFDNCKRNAARRIDSAYSQFIIDVAFDF